MPVSPVDPHIRRHEKKQCFKNSVLCMLYSGSDHQYAEGYVLKPSLPIAIHHAWVLTGEGYVLDPTLGWEPDAEYFGVAFSAREVTQRIVKNGYYGLFSNGWAISDLVLGLDKTFSYRGMQASTLTLDGDCHEPTLQSQSR